MATQTITIPTGNYATGSFSGVTWKRWAFAAGSRPQIDAAFIPSGLVLGEPENETTERYFASIVLRSDGSLTLNFTTTNGNNPVGNWDLTDQFETGGSFTLTQGQNSLTVEMSDIGDSSEPYAGNPTTSRAARQTFYNIMADAAASITLDDGAAVDPNAAPPKVTGVTATPQDGGAAFSWNTALRADSYEIDISDDNGSSWFSATSTTTSYTATGLSNDVAHLVRIRGVNETPTPNVNGPYSDNVSFTPTAPPVTITNVAVSGSTVTLTPSRTLTSSDTVSVSYTQSSTSSKILQDAAGNEVADFGPEALTNNVGATKLTTPSAPTLTIGDGQITVTFTADANAASTTLRYGTTSGSLDTVVANFASGTTISPLTNGTTYYFALVSVGDGTTYSNSDLGAEASATPLPSADAPTAVITAVATGDEGTTVQLGATIGAGGTYDGNVTYAWTVEGGTTGLSDSTSATPTWTRPAVTTDTDYTIGLTITVEGTGTNALNGTSDTTVASTVEATVSNVTTDTTAPSFVSAVLDAGGQNLVITFDEALDTGSLPGQAAFDILADGTRKSGATNATSHVVNASDNTQYLVFFTFAITSGATVTLEYTAPSTNPLQDAAGNDVVSFGPETVTTNWPLPDADAPTAVIDAVAAGDEGDTVSLTATIGNGGTYDGDVEYSWTVEGGTTGLSDATAASPTWTRPTVASDTDYTIGLTITVRGTGTNAASGTSDTTTATTVEATVNNVLPDADAPSVTIDAVAAGDEGLTVALTATIAGGTYDDLDYAWTVDDATTGLDDATIASPTWTRPAVTSDTNYTIGLTVTARGTGTTAATGTSEAQAATAIQATVNDVPSDTTAPSPVSYELNADGDLLTITFDEALDTNSNPASSAYNIQETQPSGTTRRKGGSNHRISGSTVLIDFTTAIVYNSTLTFAYTAPGTNPLQDAAGNDVADIAATAVTTNWPLPVADAPAVTITAVAAGNEGTTVTLGATVTGGTYDGSITYAWTVSGGVLDDATLAAPTWTRPSVNADTDFDIDLTVSVEGTGTNARTGTSDSQAATQIQATVNNILVTTVTANAGTDKTVDSGASVTIGGTDTIVNASGNTGISWSVVSGTTIAIGTLLDDSTIASPSFTGPTIARGGDDLTIVLRKTVTNNSITNTDDVEITVNAPDPLPTPEAGTVTITGDTTATNGDTVTLTASLGGTQTGTITYAWTGSEITAASDKTATSVDVQRSTTGNADVTLVITATGDGTTVESGTDTARDTHRVVFSALPTAVSANAGADKTVDSGGSVTIGGADSITNGVGATTIRWTLRSGGAGSSLSDDTSANPTFTAPTIAAGGANRQFVYRKTVENNGETGTDDVTITVTAPAALPQPEAGSVTITASPSNPNAGADVTLTATLSGTRRGTITYQWGDAASGTASTAVITRATGGTRTASVVITATGDGSTVAAGTDTARDSITVTFRAVQTTDRDTIYFLGDTGDTPSFTLTEGKDQEFYLPGGGSVTDDPVGPTAILQFEWVAKRKKSPGDEKWGKFSDWAQSARWGRDGNGVEYIYRLTATDDAPANPTPADTTTDDYQMDGHVPTDWHGDPQEVTSDMPFQWISQRKSRNSLWEDFSGPVKFGGGDGQEGRGVEYIFTSTTDGAMITGNANLPLASQNYDVDALRTPSGLVRGNQSYYDGTPTNLSATRPYMHRFRRPVPGQPAQNADIGDVVWLQEKGYLVIGESGAGEQTVYIRTRYPSAPSNITTTTTQDGDDTHLPTGWSRTPLDIDKDNPFEWVSKRIRQQGEESWGKFSVPQLWAQLPGASPTLHSGQSEPPLLVGDEGDTWAELNDSGQIIAVYTKYESSWLRLSGNPDNSQWTKGNGTPTSNASAGTYYGDEENGNVWVRGSGRWHWIFDLDPSGTVKWRFGSGVPSSGLGNNDDRYLRWTNAVWYEKQSGSWREMDDLSGLPVFQLPETEGGSAVRQIIKNTGSTAVNVAGTDDIKLQLSDGGFVTLDTTTVGQVFAAFGYPTSSIGSEGATFVLEQAATEAQIGVPAQSQAIVEVWHKTAPLTWSMAGNHPAFADWYCGVGPPADFNFENWFDEDGTYWLEEGAGRVWSRISGIWYWIYDLSSDGRALVYASDGPPADSRGEIGDRAVDLSTPDDEKNIINLDMYEKATSGWRGVGKFAGRPAVKAPLEIESVTFISATFTRLSDGRDPGTTLTFVLDIYPDPNPRWPKPTRYLTSFLHDNGNVRTPVAATKVSGHENRWQFSFSTRVGGSGGFITVATTYTITPQIRSPQADFNVYVSGPSTIIGSMSLDTSTLAVTFTPNVAANVSAPPSYYREPASSGVRPAPSNVRIEIPNEVVRYGDVTFDSPSGSATDTLGGTVLLVGYHVQFKKRADSWGAMVIRLGIDTPRPFRLGPLDSNSRYDVRIRSVFSDNGISTWAPGAFNTGAARTPGVRLPPTGSADYPPPTSVSADSVSGRPRTVEVTWNAPSGGTTPSGGSTALDSYEVQLKRETDTWESRVHFSTVPDFLPSFRIGQLHPEVNYELRMRSVFANGGRSVWVEDSFSLDAPPAEGTDGADNADGTYPPPTSMTARPRGLFIDLNWQPPRGGYAGGKEQSVNGYEGQIKTSAQSWSQADVITVGADIKRPVATGPGTASTTYNYRLRAIYEDGGVSNWTTATAATGAA